MTPLFETAKNAAYDAIVEELLLRDDGARIDLIEWLSGLRLGRHMYFINRSYAANVLWPELEQQRELQHTLLSAACSFHLSLNTAVEDGYSRYCTMLSKAMSSMTATFNSAKSVTDQEFANKIPTGADTVKLLSEELWLTFILTLEMQVSRLFVSTELPNAKLLHVKETNNA